MSVELENRVPQLLHRKAFEEALSNYQMSDTAKRVLDNVTLVLLSGPTAGGRNTLINQMLQTGNYRFIVSDTTRPPRVNNGVPEQTGREYWFRSEEEVLQDIRAGAYLEAEIIHQQQVSGMSIRELQKAIDAHKIAINEVEIGGFTNIFKHKPDTIAILILPPSYEEWQRRIFSRGDMSRVELRNRLQTAAKVFSEASKADYAAVIINNDIQVAAAEIDRLAHGGTVDQKLQQEGRILAKELLARTEAAISQLER